jgi:hypothetical protein
MTVPDFALGVATSLIAAAIWKLTAITYKSVVFKKNHTVRPLRPLLKKSKSTNSSLGPLFALLKKSASRARDSKKGTLARPTLLARSQKEIVPLRRKIAVSLASAKPYPLYNVNLTHSDLDHASSPAFLKTVLS